MRVARVLGEGEAFYHILSRVVDRRFVLDDTEKERFRRLMRAIEAFSGCQVLTWTCLSNHLDEMFHRHRGNFGVQRRTGARPMRSAQWNGLFVARRLQMDPIQPPDGS